MPSTDDTVQLDATPWRDTEVKIYRVDSDPGSTSGWDPTSPRGIGKPLRTIKVKDEGSLSIPVKGKPKLEPGQYAATGQVEVFRPQTIEGQRSTDQAGQDEPAHEWRAVRFTVS